MANPGKRYEEIDNRMDRFDGGDLDDSLADGSGTSSRGPEERRLSGNGVGLTERLTDVLLERGDGDLLLQQSNREDMVLQWLQALDMQVIGACRADERLTPLLKLNAPGGAAEDRLLAHLSQHFEPPEVGMLARCFCMPLVSIRVGKIQKQGTLLCPTSARGDLNLILLPTSDLRLSFVGDDGQTQRIFTLSNSVEGCLVAIEEMSEDSSGRSFLLKVPDGREFFFWCSEKSKLLGVELLRKMSDLLKRRPSAAELTGITESRLGCFATSVRAYLMGPASTSDRACVSGSPALSTASTSYNHNNATPSASKLLPPRHRSSTQASSIETSLGPRVEGSLSLRKVTEKLKKRVESSSYSSSLTAAENNKVAVMMETSSNADLHGSVQESKSSPLSPSFLESLSNLTMPPSFRPICSNQPVLSPYYCWCPPAIPKISPLPRPSLSLSDLPTIPTLLPDTFPLLDLPTPTSRQPIPTFTPLMCDPIVHIAVIDVCSAGQGYLVSAGTTIPPLHPKLVNPLVPESNSAAEEGARQTLRLLLGGSSAFPSSAGGEKMELVGSRGIGIGLISLPRISGVDNVRAEKCGGGDGNNILLSSFADIGVEDNDDDDP